MRLSKRAISSLLLAAMLATLAACGSEPAADGGNDETTSGKASDTVTETVEKADIPEDKYEGYEFRMLGKETPASSSVNELFAESETGDTLNDAIYQRNRMVEERFDVKMTLITSGSRIGDMSQAVLAGDDAYDIVLDTTVNIAPAISNRYVHSINDLQYIDIDKSWWNTELIEDSAINGNPYFLMGDISYSWRDATWVLCFNKRLYNEYGLEEPYKMVRDGKWTIDVLEEHCRDITKDLNGDAKLDKDDQWGLLSSKTAGLGLVTSSGITSVSKAKDGSLEYTLDSERNVDVLGRIRKLMTNNDLQIRAEDLTGVSSIWTEIINIFRNGRALYRISIMSDVIGLRDMNDDFGILPLPKYDENQDQYYTTYQGWSGGALVVPVTITDTARTSAIIEYMSSVSKDTITNAYYSVNLQGKVARDDDSAEMLDIIFNSMTTDIGLAFWRGTVENTLKTIINSDSDNTASTLASAKDSIAAELEKFETEAKG